MEMTSSQKILSRDDETGTHLCKVGTEADLIGNRGEAQVGRVV